MLIEFKRSSYSIHYQAWLVAGIFVLLAVSVSVYEIAMNLEYFNCPRLQIRVVRILWMVPIYAVNSWLCLRFKDASFYIDPIRECYEAFVIYNFYMYLVTYLEDEVGDPITYFSTKEQVDHLWPANKFLSTWYVLGSRRAWAAAIVCSDSPPQKGVLWRCIATRALVRLCALSPDVFMNMFRLQAYGPAVFRSDTARCSCIRHHPAPHGSRLCPSKHGEYLLRRRVS